MTVRGRRFYLFLKDRRALSSLEETDDSPVLPRLAGVSIGSSYVSSDSAETLKPQPDLGAGPMRAAQLSSARWHFGMRAFYHRSR